MSSIFKSVGRAVKKVASSAKKVVTRLKPVLLVAAIAYGGWMAANWLGAAGAGAAGGGQAAYMAGPGGGAFAGTASSTAAGGTAAGNAAAAAGAQALPLGPAAPPIQGTPVASPGGASPQMQTRIRGGFGASPQATPPTPPNMATPATGQAGYMRGPGGGPFASPQVSIAPSVKTQTAATEAVTAANSGAPASQVTQRVGRATHLGMGGPGAGSAHAEHIRLGGIEGIDKAAKPSIMDRVKDGFEKVSDFAEKRPVTTQFLGSAATNIGAGLMQPKPANPRIRGTYFGVDHRSGRRLDGSKVEPHPGGLAAMVGVPNEQLVENGLDFSPLDPRKIHPGLLKHGIG